ncbi:hypothetical protein [Hyalangium minutum]|uniref:hypothetical protein n=1 Tax=Hyalangium minutum TaxID=394096 RepID=UPI0012F8C6DE|nr:hypothetical protein [Hyalangium minutum]
MNLLNPPLLAFLVALTAPAALAEPVTVNPETQLSLDFTVKDATSCILKPAERYDPQACAGIPKKDAADPASGDPGVRALVIVRQAENVFVLTVASIKRSGIGQMYDQNIQGFLEGTRQRLTEDFGASVKDAASPEKPYTLQRVGGVPVVRWEYTTELPEEDDRAHTASAVVYLIPSKDTLDILSINTHQRNLAAAQSVGDQVISTLRLPLTIDADAFGGDMAFALGKDIASGLVLVALVVGLAVAMWRRSRKAS